MIIRLLTGAALALLLAGAAAAEPPPLQGWDKVRFGMTSKALLEAYPGVTWTEEAGATPAMQARTFNTKLDGGDYTVTVILTNDRVSRVSVSKVLPTGLDEAACKAAFAPDLTRLQAAFGPPTETGPKGARWQLGGGSRLVIVNVLFAPDDGSATRCVVSQGYYPPGSPPAPAG